jgi:nitrogen fixation/metabolism regulation signal transduction histidine kinase
MSSARLRTRLMTTFLLTALPAALVAAATVVFLFRRLGDEIQRRSDEVAASTRAMIKSESERVSNAVEGFVKSEELRQSVEASERADEEDEATRMAARNRLLGDGAKLFGLDVLALVEMRSQDDAVILGSAHLPTSVGDEAPRFVLSLAAQSATVGFAHELISGNPLAWSPVIIAARVLPQSGPDGLGSRGAAALPTRDPKSGQERPRFVVYGGSRLDLRLEEAAESNGARLVLDSRPMRLFSFPARPRFEISEATPAGIITLAALARGRDASLAHAFVDPARAGAPSDPPVIRAHVDNTHLQQARVIATAAALVIGGIIVVALFVWTWLSRRITQPILELSGAALQVGAGNLEVRIEPRSKDEVGALVEVFNQMTTEIGESRLRLQRAERIAAWREIARRVAHEIKNPLFPIQMSMETLRKGFKAKHPQLEEIVEESTRTVLDEVRALNRIVTEFSDFARLPAPKMEPAPPLEVLEHARSLYKDGGAVAVTLDRSAIAERALPPIHIDREQISRALINLVKNAIEAMPESGGTVTLDAHLEPRGRRVGVRIDVSDTGKGMPEDVRQRIFTPYFTTKEQGTGLGLAIVERIVQEHQGAIDVQSTPGAGTTFSVWLPAAVGGSE